jgi:hypothetical protein
MSFDDACSRLTLELSCGGAGLEPCCRRGPTRASVSFNDSLASRATKWIVSGLRVKPRLEFAPRRSRQRAAHVEQVPAHRAQPADVSLRSRLLDDRSDLRRPAELRLRRLDGAKHQVTAGYEVCDLRGVGIVLAHERLRVRSVMRAWLANAGVKLRGRERELCCREECCAPSSASTIR